MPIPRGVLDITGQTTGQFTVINPTRMSDKCLWLGYQCGACDRKFPRGEDHVYRCPQNGCPMTLEYTDLANCPFDADAAA